MEGSCQNGVGHRKRAGPCDADADHGQKKNVFVVNDGNGDKSGVRRTEDTKLCVFFAEFVGNHGEDERKTQNRQQNTLRNRSHPIRLLPRRAAKRYLAHRTRCGATATGKYSHIQNKPSQVRSWTGASWRMVCGIARMAVTISFALDARPVFSFFIWRKASRSSGGYSLVVRIVQRTAPKKAAAPM